MVNPLDRQTYRDPVAEEAFRDPEVAYMARIARDLGARASYSPRTASTFNSSGTFTPNASGLYRIQALGAGGGGAGGASALTSGTSSSGGGGGGGGVTTVSFQNLVGGTGYTVTIGAVGTGGASVASGGVLGHAGGAGGDTIVAAPTVQHAPGGGGGLAGVFVPAITAVSIVGDILTLTIGNALGSVNTGFGAFFVISGAAGGTWGSAGTTGTGINGISMPVSHTSSTTTVELQYGNGGTAPSGTYTGSSGLLLITFVSGGLPGGGTTFNQLTFTPGVGGASIPVGASYGVVATAGSPSFGGMGGSGGGGGLGSVAGTNGGNGGSAGTLASGGAAGSGSSGSVNGGTGSNAAANSGCGGGGGGGGTSTGTGAAGGNGGTGQAVIEGPLVI